MARFTYRGIDDRGRESRGSIEAASLVRAARELRGRGISSHSLERDDWEAISKPVGEIDGFSYFNRTLAGLSRAGVPLPRAVRDLSRGLRRGRFREKIEGVEKALGEGKSLDQAVAEAKGTFPPYYDSMVRAGIAAGNLPRVLHAVARTHEGIRRARRAVFSALAYPAVSFAIGVILMTVFFIFLVPQVAQFYRVYRIAPSFPASLLIRAFHTPQTAVLGLLSAALGIGAAIVWLRRTASGESILHAIPAVGPVLRSLVLARFLGVLSILLQAKSLLPDALAVAAGASGSRRLRSESERLRARATEGEKLSEVLRDSRVVSPDVAAYLVMAEEGGGLAEGAGELAEMHAERSASRSDVLFMALFPLAMIAVGLVLGTVILAFASSYLDVLKQVPR